MLRPTVKKQNFQKYKQNIKDHVTVRRPFKPLTTKYNSKYGRNHTGQITVRHKERGAKKTMRIISYVRQYKDIVGTVKTIEYCPNKSAFICLVEYTQPVKGDENSTLVVKKFEYILHPEGVKVDDTVLFSDSEIKISPGNCTKLKNIPQGECVHNIEYRPGAGAQIVRSAGCFATVIDHVDGYVLLKLMSGFMIKAVENCYACCGAVSNARHNTRMLYKAGQSRNFGIRPSVRGVAMNPNSHPHGGGEGKSGTKRHPVSYTSQLTKGRITRGKRSLLNKNIISRKKK